MNIQPCPFCGSTEYYPDPDAPNEDDFIVDFWCDDCGNGFELGFSTHSSDESGNPDLNEISGGRV